MILTHHPQANQILTVADDWLLESSPDAGATDEHIVDLWLHGRSEHTVRAYRRIVDRFRAAIGKPFRAVTLGDLQGYADELAGADSSRAQSIAVIKSLFSFAAKLGALRFNVGAALRKPKSRDTLADRILGEHDVARMLALTEGRDHALIRLAYAGGFRVSELVSIRWRDLAEASDGGFYITVMGKGGKTRTVRVSSATAATVRALRGAAPSDAYIFAPGPQGVRTGRDIRLKKLDPSQAWRIVRAAAKRAGIDKEVSPHFLRHAHASHALERGAKLAVVRDTLGHSSIAVTNAYVHARPEESSGLALAV